MMISGKQLSIVMILMMFLVHYTPVYAIIPPSCGCQSSLTTVDDLFYDPHAEVVLNKTDDDNPSILTLPINISNTVGSDDSVFSSIGVSKGGFHYGDSFPYVRMLRPVAQSSLTNGYVIVHYSTNKKLLYRASEYIEAHRINAPTHLIIMDNIDIGDSMSSTGNAFQTVLATNGQYSYLILLFINVEPESMNRDVSEITLPNSTVLSFPYANNITEVPIESNIDIPGQYVIDMNEEKPPPPPCPCKKIMLATTCEYLYQQGQDLPKACFLKKHRKRRGRGHRH